MDLRAMIARLRDVSGAPDHAPREGPNAIAAMVDKLFGGDDDAEPDVDLALAICAAVNERGAASSAVWDVADCIVAALSSGGTSRRIVALFLADLLVMHCGFPAHLAATRRDFVHAVVSCLPPRQGGDRGPCGPLERAALRLLSNWRASLCAPSSQHARDFALVREACALAASRGYALPPPDADYVSGMLASGLAPRRLRPKAAIIRDERTVQEAKLQLLLRRGKPDDLRTANRLMRMLATPDDAPDGVAVGRADRVIEADLLECDRMHRSLCEMLWGRTDAPPGAERPAPDETILSLPDVRRLISELSDAMPRLHVLSAASDLHPVTLGHTLALYDALFRTLSAAGVSVPCLALERPPAANKNAEQVAAMTPSNSAGANPFALIALDDEGAEFGVAASEMPGPSLLDGADSDFLSMSELSTLGAGSPAPRRKEESGDPFGDLVDAFLHRDAQPAASGSDKDALAVQALRTSAGVLVQRISYCQKQFILAANVGDSGLAVRINEHELASGASLLLAQSDAAPVRLELPDGRIETINLV